MQITEPTPDEVAAVFAANQHRFPEISHISVTGDRGVTVRLPFVLGNPSGACKMPAARQPSTVWNSFVSAALTRGKLPEGEEAGAQDAMLWPPPATWAQWSERWPALAGKVWTAIKRKCGAMLEGITEPDYTDDRLPDAVKAALAANPRAALRRYETHRGSFLMLVDPPPSAAWRIFTASIAPGSEAAKSAREMAQVCTRFIFNEKSAAEVSFEAMVAEWPGLAVQACLTVSVLAGAAADIELGE
jgi:hypothetical protein